MTLTVSRKIYIYTFIDSFVSMSLILLVPLYLVSLGISLASIGFILALAPIAFALLRVFLAEIADSGRTYGILKLGAVLRGVSPLLYLMPMNFFTASFANVFSGFAGSPIWTVNRKILYENDRDSPSGRKASILKNVREAADGVAKIFSLFVVQVAGFFASFLALFAAGLLLFFPVRGLAVLGKGERRKRAKSAPSFRAAVSSFNLWGYGKRFARIALAGTVTLAVDGVIFSFAAGIFLKEIVRLSYLEVGLYLAIFSLVSFTSLFFFLHQKRFKRISPASAFVFGAFLALSLAALYFFPNRAGALAFVILIGLSDGVRSAYIEEMVAFAVSTDGRARKSPAKAIATMGFWAQASKSVAIFSAGVIAEVFGFGPVFLIVSAMNAGYAVFAYRTLSKARAAN